MPNHVHLLIRPRLETYDIGRILKSIKGPFAKRLVSYWKKEYPARLKRLEVRTSSGIAYRVWQRGGGFDRNLYKQDIINEAVRYIEGNPVRAGHVSDPGEWKWSSASARLGCEKAILPVDDVEL